MVRPIHDIRGREICANVWAHAYYVHECSDDADHKGACKCGGCGRYFNPETCTPLHRALLDAVQHVSKWAPAQHPAITGARATYRAPRDSREAPPRSAAAMPRDPADIIAEAVAEPTTPIVLPIKRTKAPRPATRGPMTASRRAALTLDAPWECACGWTTTWKPGVGRHRATCTKTTPPAHAQEIAEVA